MLFKEKKVYRFDYTIYSDQIRSYFLGARNLAEAVTKFNRKFDRKCFIYDIITIVEITNDSRKEIRCDRK